MTQLVQGQTTVANGSKKKPILVDPNGKLLTAASGELPAGTNRSGSITTGGTAQQLAAANPDRLGLDFQNISAGDLWINETGGTAAVNTAGSWKIATGQFFSVATNQAISIVGATTGQAWTATEY